MVCGVLQQAKRANDNVCATNITKRTKIGPRLETVSRCSVVLKDLMIEPHVRARIFERIPS